MDETLQEAYTLIYAFLAKRAGESKRSKKTLDALQKELVKAGLPDIAGKAASKSGDEVLLLAKSNLTLDASSSSDDESSSSSSDDSSSSSSSDSSDSESEKKQSAQVQRKVVSTAPKAAPKAIESSSDSSDSGAGDEPPAKSRESAKSKNGKASSTSSSASSSSSSELDSEAAPKKDERKGVVEKVKDMIGDAVDSFASLKRKADDAAPIDAPKKQKLTTVTTTSTTTTTLIPQDNRTSKKQKNEPFRRIKAEEVTFADPRLQDNSFAARQGRMNDYGAKASADLIVTRGKGFTKEKNKKKRGSYRGGEITMESHSIKFD